MLFEDKSTDKLRADYIINVAFIINVLKVIIGVHYG